jgi:hypothetical protein
MFKQEKICELLVASCHSDVEARSFFESNISNPDLVALLYNIARDDKSVGGDAPMQAAYYLSKCPRQLLSLYQDGLMEILPLVDGYGGHIALSLAKADFLPARELIINELGDGKRFDAWLYMEALKIYEENSL